MNYIDITQSTHTLKVNINYNGNLAEGEFICEIYKDGSDTLVGGRFEVSAFDFNYYQTIVFDNGDVTLEDNRQYNITILDIASDFKVVYRGKFQTTSKDINNLSINEGQYIKKTTATNYTILD